MTLRIDHLGRDGDGVGRDDLGPLFVRDALPGEVVRVGPVAENRGIRRATLLEVRTPSPLRRPDPCSTREACGGCPLGHAQPTLSAQSKREAFVHALRVNGLAAPEILLETPAPHRGYRVRARLAFDGGNLGFRAQSSHHVVVPLECGVLSRPVEAARTALGRAISAFVGRGEARIAESESVGGGTGVVVAIETETPHQPTTAYSAIESLVAEGTILGARLRVDGIDAYFGQVEELSRDADGRLLATPIGAFRQAHREAPRAIAEALHRRLDVAGLRVLELFAGSGQLTLGLAARARSVVAIELEVAAVTFLRRNLAANGLMAAAHARDALDYLRSAGPVFDAIVIDPPRRGAKDLLAEMTRLRPAAIAAVSCDGATFARDAGLLQAAGYSMTSAVVIDLFPDTLHSEVVAVFRDTRVRSARRDRA